MRWSFLLLCFGLASGVSAQTPAPSPTTFQALTLNPTTASTLSATTVVGSGQSGAQGYATQCLGSVQNGPVNFRVDGPAPTSAVGGGIPAQTGDQIWLQTPVDVAAFQIIAQWGTPIVSFTCRWGTQATPSAPIVIVAANRQRVNPVVTYDPAFLPCNAVRQTNCQPKGY